VPRAWRFTLTGEAGGQLGYPPVLARRPVVVSFDPVIEPWQSFRSRP